MLRVDAELGSEAATELVGSIYDRLRDDDPKRRTADAIAAAVAHVLAFEAKAGIDPAEFKAALNEQLEENGVPWRIAEA